LAALSADFGIRNIENRVPPNFWNLCLKTCEGPWKVFKSFKKLPSIKKSVPSQLQGRTANYTYGNKPIKKEYSH
jgi:hypothetical protein